MKGEDGDMQWWRGWRWPCPAGSLITMTDGTKLPVQKVRVGDSVIVYDVQTGYMTTAVVTEIEIFVARNLLTLPT